MKVKELKEILKMANDESTVTVGHPYGDRDEVRTVKIQSPSNSDYSFGEVLIVSPNSSEEG